MHIYIGNTAKKHILRVFRQGAFTVKTSARLEQATQQIMSRPHRFLAHLGDGLFGLGLICWIGWGWLFFVFSA